MATPTEIRQRLYEEVEHIRGHADLTEEAKQRRIAEATQEADAEYQEAAEAREQAIKERVERAEKALFQTPYPFGGNDVEMAQLRALRRSAYNEVYDRTTPLFDSGDPDSVRKARKELERLFQRAERTGDHELAAAVFHVATERGERGVADAYLETRPKEKQRWEEYVAARTEAESLERLFSRAITAGLSPSVVGR